MPTKRPKPPEPRMWRVSVIKKKLEFLGRVRAIDKEDAAAVATAEFRLRDHEVQRLVISESTF